MQKNILIISDSTNLYKPLQNHREHNSIRVSCSQIVNEEVKHLSEKNCNLVILNMLMTEQNGFDLLFEIRKFNSVPILVISSNGSIIDKVSALRMGADDYLISPFEDSELVARVHSLIRRYTVLNHNSEYTDLLQNSDLSIDISTRAVSRNNKHISLTPKEFDILCFFASNKGKVFTKEQIYSHVWGSEYAVDDGNITAHIRRVRKKIEPNPEIPIYIKTVWGVGYQFCESEEKQLCL